MQMKKKILSVIFLMFCGTFCFARQISFQIIQHDENSKEMFEQSLIIEDTLLNGFFDEGYIVTNSSAEISESDNQDESLFKKGIGEAFEGYSDYFVQIKLYYESGEVSVKNKRNIEQIEWVLASTNTGVTIMSTKLNSDKLKNEDVKSISSNLLLQIKKALKA